MKQIFFIFFIFISLGFSAQAANDLWSLKYSYVKNGPAGTCAINANKKLECWGMGLPIWEENRVLNPFLFNENSEISALNNVKEVHHSNRGICVMLEGGEVRCFLEDALASINNMNKEFLSLSVSYTNACGILKNKDAFCWGEYFQSSSSTPLPSDMGSVEHIATSDRHSCAVTSSDKMYCWGSLNSNSYLMREYEHGKDVGKVKSLTTSHLRTCIVDEQNQLACWLNFSGDPLYKVNGMQDVAQVSLNKVSASLREGENFQEGRHFICGIKLDNSVFCSHEGYEYVPENLGNVVQITVDGDKACALDDLSEVTCWGDYPQNGTFSPRDFKNVKSVSVEFGYEHVPVFSYPQLAGQKMCLHYLNNTVKCFGTNRGIWSQPEPNYPYGRFHNNLFPNDISQLSNAESVRVGDNQGCSLNNDQSLYCWGFQVLNYREGKYRNINMPDYYDYKGLSIGQNHLCALRNNGKVICSGFIENTNSTYYDSHLFSDSVYSQLENVISITSFSKKSCALDANRVITCFGLFNLNEKIELPQSVGTPTSIFHNNAANFPCVVNSQKEVYCEGETGYELVASDIKRVSDGKFLTILHRDDEENSVIIDTRDFRLNLSPTLPPQKMGKIKQLVIGRFNRTYGIGTLCGISDSNEFGCWAQ